MGSGLSYMNELIVIQTSQVFLKLKLKLKLNKLKKGTLFIFIRNKFKL